MASFKDAHGRFVPPREWELSTFGLAIFVVASVPLAWVLHGFAKVGEPWIVIPVAAVLIGGGLWLRRKRRANTRSLIDDGEVR